MILKAGSVGRGELGRREAICSGTLFSAFPFVDGGEPFDKLEASWRKFALMRDDAGEKFCYFLAQAISFEEGRHVRKRCVDCVFQGLRAGKGRGGLSKEWVGRAVLQCGRMRSSKFAHKFAGLVDIYLVQHYPISQGKRMRHDQAVHGHGRCVLHVPDSQNRIRRIILKPMTTFIDTNCNCKCKSKISENSEIKLRNLLVTN